MERQDSNSMKEYESKAEELVALTLGVCEQRLATCECRREALSSAALCVRDSVKTFLAVTRLPHMDRGDRE